jgi:casein kinase II subunit beta
MTLRLRWKNTSKASLGHVHEYFAMGRMLYPVEGRIFLATTRSNCTVLTVATSIPLPAVGSKALTVRICCDNGSVRPTHASIGYTGAFFGTTFPHLFFQSYRELAPAPFWKPTSGQSSTPTSSRSVSPDLDAPEENGQSKRVKPPPFVNPNPHGGKKRPAGRVYQPKIYGFRVSEQAKNGPRMLWMRLRPQDPEELDMVDWRGRFYDDEDDEYDHDGGAGEEDRPMEDFDPVSGACACQWR